MSYFFCLCSLSPSLAIWLGCVFTATKSLWTKGIISGHHTNICCYYKLTRIARNAICPRKRNADIFIWQSTLNFSTSSNTNSYSFISFWIWWFRLSKSSFNILDSVLRVLISLRNSSFVRFSSCSFFSISWYW